MALERIETTLLVLFALVVTISTFPATLHARHLTALVQKQPLTLAYHKGYLLTGPRVVHLIWYGNFTISQRAVISDFVTSLSSTSTLPPPSVATWWTTVEKYHHQTKTPKVSLSLGPQTFDPTSSLGKHLTSSQLLQLASRGGRRRAINVVLTAADVAVEGFCMSRCGTHGSSPRSKKGRYAYLWVGNSAVQCPGHCAWPFHQPIYGPQTPPLLSPNGDVGVDGMVINLAKLLVGAVTNPFGDGFYQGEKGAEMDVASACNGVFGKGAYPGYPGKVLVDGVNGGSYNANGVNGRKYLLPAMVDPNSAMCSTLV